MLIAVVVIAVVVVVIVGGVLSLRGSAKTGMPSQDVLDRATQRAREQDGNDKD